MSDTQPISMRLRVATPAENSMHNNFLISISEMKKGLVRSAFYLAIIADRRVFKVLGYKTAADYAADVAGLSHRQAKELIRMGRKLRGLPEFTAALNCGTLSWTSARNIVSKATPENEHELLEFARKASEKAITEKLKTAMPPINQLPLNKQRSQSNPDRQINSRPTISRNHTPQEQKSRATEPRMPITLSLSHEQYARWESILASLRRCGVSGSLPELHINGLEKLLQNANPVRSNEYSPTYFITFISCPNCDQTVLNTSRGRQPISHALLQSITCDAIVEQDINSQITRRSIIPPRLRRFVLRRDLYQCQAEGCQHTQHLEIHHRIPQSQGGRMVVENLITLCRRCHRTLHGNEDAVQKLTRIFSDTEA